ncbi:hypothetical protein DEA06_05610 [Microbacterium sp. Gd 4-13]|nr:hypothetical protein DEA06_05610 [Microbacterium sp. Gd 4-13]
MRRPHTGICRQPRRVRRRRPRASPRVVGCRRLGCRSDRSRGRSCRCGAGRSRAYRSRPRRDLGRGSLDVQRRHPRLARAGDDGDRALNGCTHRGDLGGVPALGGSEWWPGGPHSASIDNGDRGKRTRNDRRRRGGDRRPGGARRVRPRGEGPNVQVIVADASIAFGSFTVFDGFSARFEAGQVTALVGPSGSGKSSLLAAMAGYVRLRDGSITIVDQGTSLSPHADLVSWVPQGSNALARRSVLDNVLIASLAAGLAMREAVDVAEDALSQVDLMTRSGEQARRLSGGELQRVAIARALASGKDLILADEPSANLDERNTNEVAAILNRLVSRATIIVATHDPILVSSSHAAVHMRQQVSTVG